MKIMMDPHLFHFGGMLPLAMGLLKLETIDALSPERCHSTHFKQMNIPDRQVPLRFFPAFKHLPNAKVSTTKRQNIT